MSNLFDLSSLAMIPTAYKDGKLYSVRPTDGSGDFTFSRGSNLAATRVSSSGYIEKGRENLLLQSNTFDTTWTLNNSSLTSGQAGYDGTNDAWELQATSTSSARVQQFESNTNVQSLSIYAKAGTANFILAEKAGTNGFYAWFDLSNGTIGNTSGDIDTTIEDVGNGWYRCSISGNPSAASKSQFYVAETNGSTTISVGGSIYIQDAQLEQGLVATDYIETTTTSVSAGILEDMPRLDYSSGSCPSLLLEPQRTNDITQSEYFGDSYWTKYRSSVNSNVTKSPDGYNNAFEIIEDTTTNTHIIGRSFAFTSGVVYSGSIFAKYNGRNLLLSAGNTSTWSAKAIFDLENGTINSTILGSAQIEDYGNGWYRCTIIGTAGATSSTNFNIQILNGFTGTYLGDGASGSYFYGAQLEAGSYPTSYIPTYGSAVTRSVDAMANLDIPDFNNNTSFSFLLELTRNGISSSEIGSMFSFYNDSSTQQFWFHIDAPSGQVRLRDATNSNATMATISFDTDDRKKIAFSCDGSTLKTYVDGVLSNTYNLVNVFNVDELRTAAKSFDVHQIVIFPTALTDSECIALTE
jgi:hypothetical protein